MWCLNLPNTENDSLVETETKEQDEEFDLKTIFPEWGDYDKVIGN